METEDIWVEAQAQLQRFRIEKLSQNSSEILKDNVQ